MQSLIPFYHTDNFVLQHNFTIDSLNLHMCFDITKIYKSLASQQLQSQIFTFITKFNDQSIINNITQSFISQFTELSKYQIKQATITLTAFQQHLNTLYAKFEISNLTSAFLSNDQLNDKYVLIVIDANYDKFPKLCDYQFGKPFIQQFHLSKGDYTIVLNEYNTGIVLNINYPYELYKSLKFNSTLYSEDVISEGVKLMNHFDLCLSNQGFLFLILKSFLMKPNIKCNKTYNVQFEYCCLHDDKYFTFKKANQGFTYFVFRLLNPDQIYDEQLILDYYQRQQFASIITVPKFNNQIMTEVLFPFDNIKLY